MTSPHDARPASSAAAPQPNGTRALDDETGGAFSAPTSGERAARVREWLAGNPSAERMAEVFKELSSRDKGAAKALKEKLDELKRAKGQEHMASEWAGKAQALLDTPRLNIADALAWQRDAAKAGAPLSKEPLATLKTALVERVKTIEDLQHRVFVEREAAVLLAQRIELLSTKSWHDAQAAREGLAQDVTHWHAQAGGLLTHAQWPSVDPKFTPQMEASRAQLQVVWEAFDAALALTATAAQDSASPLPAVPVWADEIRASRGAAQPAADGGKEGKPRMDPAELKEKRQHAAQAVGEQLQTLEQELQEGHGKASAAAANALRHALKDHGQWLDDKTNGRAHSALAAAGELEGWQRWRADQIREELLHKAQALVVKPLGGRKQQEAVRGLREAWKQTDAGGHPNHGLWRKFDAACTEAHKIVEAWLEKVKEQSEATRAQRLALIDELKAWTTAHATATDWKRVARELHGFSERWRESGHMSEKAFAEVQPQWKEAVAAAHAPLDAVQAESRARRSAMIDHARELGAQPQLNIAAIRNLQQHWQAEAQAVPLERKLEQKLWDTFRAPIDEAFNRKTAQREQQAAALGAVDRAVLEAAKAVEAANASGDAQKIRAALAGLEAAVRGQAAQQAAAPALEQKEAVAGVESAQDATKNIVNEADTEPPLAEPSAPEPGLAADAGATPPPTPDALAPTPVVAKPAKPVVAVRGDDRPGAKRTEPTPAGRFGDKGGKFGDRRGAAGRDGAPRRDERPGPGRGGFDERRGPGGRDARDLELRGPRLGDAAFRAQREAMERAEFALKKLASQAHGEVLVGLLGAWQQRDASALPPAKELGRGVSPALRQSWAAALGQPPATTGAAESLLRLEMAAEAPTPAEFLSARRMLQLQLLTQRNAPGPQDTWGADVAKVLAGAHDETSARRVQNVLKVLLRG